ncbi:MAG TPA: alpha/beta hydrolase [Candidatus Angelobacter sp.]|nr:alpha/beta hydrolase [Candidatus Angelobacter sp.]
MMDRPSLRARVATRMVRVVVKHWARGSPEAVVRRARWVFGYPGFLTFVHSHGVRIKRVETPEVRGEWVCPASCSLPDRVLLYLHGGGYVSCSSRTHRPVTTSLARMAQCRVFSLDYRWAPEYPFPAAVDDAAAAFSWLVKSGVAPGNIALAGDSAGAGLVIATMLRLRAQGRALPGCAVCLSPWVDLTGAAKYQNAGSCSMFQPVDIAIFGGLYLQGASPESPEASPLFADLSGLPPLLIQVSSKELLLDDAVRLHQKAVRSGVKSTLSVFPELPHVWQILFGLIPEASTALHQIANFIRASFGIGELPAAYPVMSEGKTPVSAVEKIPK